KNSPYIYTYITLSKKGFKNLYIPITLIRNDIEKNQINNKNFDILSWGLNLDKSNSIYTLTLDVKNLSDVKEAKFKFLNSITKTAQNIKIDRIVKTNGFEEEDITLTNPLYRDEDNIEDYKDFSSKKMKEKLEKLEVKNPVKLSNSLETGYKYVFFIKKDAENKNNLLLDFEAKTNDEKPLKKEVEIAAKDPKVANILNKFIALKDSENTPKAEEKAKVYGKFTIKKTDEKDNPLKDAEFRLSRRTENVKKEDLSPENFEPVTKRSGEDGKLEFDKLEPGIYTLEEVKALYGYQELKYKYVVIVQEYGDTFVVKEDIYNSKDYPVHGEIQSLDGKIKVTDFKIEIKKNSSQYSDSNIIDPRNAEHFIMKTQLEMPSKVRAGDTFTLKLDKRLDMKGISLVDKFQKDFIYRDKVVAKHIKTEFNNEQYTFIYQMTNLANNFTNIKLSMERPLFINANKVLNDDTINDAKIKIGGVEKSIFPFIVRYSKTVKELNYYWNYDYTGLKFYYDKKNNNIVSYIYAYSNHVNSLKISTENMNTKNAFVEVYKVTNSKHVGDNGLPKSYGPEGMNFENKINTNSINYENKIEITNLPENNMAYIIKVSNVKIINDEIDSSITSNIGNVSYIAKKQKVTGSGGAEGKDNPLDPILSTVKVQNISLGKFDILKKSNSLNGDIFLKNAEFTLFRDDKATKPLKIIKDLQGKITVIGDSTQGTQDYKVTSDDKGIASFVNLPSGTYYLKETRAPKGYFLNPDAIWRVIVQNDGKVKISELNNIDKNLYKIVDDGENIVKIEIVNKIVVYPATGGIGTRIFTFIGLSLMSIAYIELKRNKKYIKKGE
ncbi:SpaA isopeptide-forming pilin-related protein, partial [Helcococcus ovis]